MSDIRQKHRPLKVGIICGSQRKPRAGDQITDFVFKTIAQYITSKDGSGEKSHVEFDHIDVAALDLPFFDEPGIPSKITSADGYAHEHTRVWSRRIAALDAFVFVTPQYNWGIPAGLKNAIDYLFNEWKNKPAVIVSYGGHGGDKAASALKICLAGGIDMKVGDNMVVNLAFPDRTVLVKAARGLDLGLDVAKEDGTWSSEKKKIGEAWDALVSLAPRIE